MSAAEEKLIPVSPWVQMARKLGARYATESLAGPQPSALELFECTEDGQREIVAQVRAYCRTMPDRVKAGQSVVFFGPVGTGKDHLMAHMLHTFYRYRGRATWLNAEDLWSRLRDAIGEDLSEKTIDDELTRCEVLALSDPVPAAGGLSPHQARSLFRILDRRYRDLRPTWVTMNTNSSVEAAKAIGAAVVDRLKDNALTLWCNWESHRQAAHSATPERSRHRVKDPS